MSLFCLFLREEHVAYLYISPEKLHSLFHPEKYIMIHMRLPAHPGPQMPDNHMRH